MTRKLGELGCSGPEARDRLQRLLKMGLEGAINDDTIPLTLRNKQFLNDMVEALKANPNYEPSAGEIFYAQDLFDRVIL